MVEASLVCPVCGYRVERASVGEVTRCPRCGSPLTVDYGASKSVLRRLLWESRLRSDKGVWSFYPLLPSAREGETLGEAWTPLVNARRLASRLGLARVLLKNEALNPTGTFIDRGAAVEVQLAVERGTDSLVVAGLGDLASAVAAYAVRRGLSVTVYARSGLETSRLYGLVLQGATLMLAKSTDDALRRGERAASLKNSILVTPVSTGLIEGYRTLVYEVYAMGVRPDAILVPVGDGVLAISVYKAVRELEEVVGEAPRVIAVRVGQPGLGLSELVVEKPLAYEHAVKAVKATGGYVVEVEPSEVYSAVRLVAQSEGIVVDPAGASTVAALYKLASDGGIDRGETVVALLTGGGSRDPLLLLEAIRSSPELEARLPDSEEQVLLSHVKKRILEILAERRILHTYGIWKLLVSEGVNVSLATVHQHVKGLEARGLIARVGRDGKRILYALTTKGYEVLRRSR